MGRAGSGPLDAAQEGGLLAQQRGRQQVRQLHVPTSLRRPGRPGPGPGSPAQVAGECQERGERDRELCAGVRGEDQRGGAYLSSQCLWH